MTTSNAENFKSIQDVFGVTSPLSDTSKIPFDAIVPAGAGANVDVDPFYTFNYRQLRRAFLAIASSQPLWLHGPSGSGKTEFAKQLGARLERPVFVISFNEETSLRDLLGGFRLKQEDGSTVTVFEYGHLAKALMTEKAIIVLDEANMAHPGVSAALNHLLEAREIAVPETGEVIKQAEGIAIMATANTAGGIDESGIFAGSQVQNGATRNRFVGMRIGYLSYEEEVAMIVRRFPLLGDPPLWDLMSGPDVSTVERYDMALAHKLVDLAQSIRALVEQGAVSLPFTVRTLCALGKGLTAFCRIDMPATLAPALEDAWASAYWDMLTPSEQVPVGEVFHRVFGRRIDI